MPKQQPPQQHPPQRRQQPRQQLRKPAVNVDDELIAIGSIRRPIGLDGLVAVSVFGETFERLSLPCEVVLSRDNDLMPATLAEVRADARGWSCRFEQFGDRTAAEALCDRLIMIKGSDLAPVNENRYYHFELAGMAVRTASGREIGTVADVHNYPTIDAIEIVDGKGVSRLVPLIRSAVTSIDAKNRTITVDEAMLEDILL
jgi:16S rRNA processing protein RimM